MFNDDTKNDKLHPRSIDKHLNKTAVFGKQKFRKLLYVANTEESSIDQNEYPKSCTKSFIEIIS